MRPMVLGFLAACSSGADTDVADSDGNTVNDAVCTEPAELACVDEIILDLALHDDMTSTGAVESSADGGDFVTTVDATAGGFGNETENPWVYVKFTATGAERVDIDDETALESMDWDVAARRFILRLNGGTSGPSCVGAAAFLESSYADLVAQPPADLAGLPYVEDDFYTDDCTIINDSSGLPGSPQVALAPWWEYPGCVATTGHPFVLQLADGRHVAFSVEAYYASGQDTCNSTGASGTGSGTYTWRWRFLE
jgi:hypothetical protein